ncbi:hypothetical protein C8R46DRAFT_391184 [Mycena filopes]|nr:hypothetical protein C8R46DRAFT_391184 [Mycena filopes]
MLRNKDSAGKCYIPHTMVTFVSRRVDANLDKFLNLDYDSGNSPRISSLDTAGADPQAGGGMQARTRTVWCRMVEGLWPHTLLLTVLRDPGRSLNCLFCPTGIVLTSESGGEQYTPRMAFIPDSWRQRRQVWCPCWHALALISCLLPFFSPFVLRTTAVPAHGARASSSRHSPMHRCRRALISSASRSLQTSLTLRFFIEQLSAPRWRGSLWLGDEDDRCPLRRTGAQHEALGSLVGGGAGTDDDAAESPTSFFFAPRRCGGGAALGRCRRPTGRRRARRVERPGVLVGGARLVGGEVWCGGRGGRWSCASSTRGRRASLWCGDAVCVVSSRRGECP